MKYIFFPVLLLLISCDATNISIDDDNIDSLDNNSINEQVDYEKNEDGLYQDFLTPNYYSLENSELRNDINKFINFIRRDEYYHPMKNNSGDIQPYNIKRSFGDGIGPTNVEQHHPAIDMYPSSSVNLFAMHDGTVHTYKDNPKYRHHLSITKDIIDDDSNVLGKLVSIYAHIDLDLDEAENLKLEGTVIKKGQLISKNLYSGTVGGMHLHLEIRFYKIEDSGTEEFYLWQNNSEFTNQSSGFWSYGYWNPNIAYGYGNPKNFGIE